MFGLLNLGSLLFGLVAWILPIVNLLQHNKTNYKSHASLSLVSFSACAISLYMQILYGNHLVRIEDWSALMDTSNAVALVSTLLLIGTGILNAIPWYIQYKK